MKKIINRKLYDTTTAEKQGSYSYGSGGDLDYICETLYLKKSGEFFLHAEGGARTRYGKAVGPNSWASGETIMPLTYEAAREWAEENLTAEKYQNIFGEIAGDDGDDVKALSFKLKASAAKKLKRDAAERGITQLAYLEALIYAGLAENEANPGIKFEIDLKMPKGEGADISVTPTVAINVADEYKNKFDRLLSKFVDEFKAKATSFYIDLATLGLENR